MSVLIFILAAGVLLGSFLGYREGTKVGFDRGFERGVLRADKMWADRSHTLVDTLADGATRRYAQNRLCGWMGKHFDFNKGRCVPKKAAPR